MLLRKKFVELMEPYDARSAAATDFVRLVRPSLAVSESRLLDPSEPTIAETYEPMEAIVMSRETTRGAEQINEGRVRRGFLPLEMIAVELVGLGVGEGRDAKLSSSYLRQVAADSSA